MLCFDSDLLPSPAPTARMAGPQSSQPSSRQSRYESPPPSPHRLGRGGQRPPSFHSHDTHDPTPRYDGSHYDEDDFSDINVDDGAPDAAYRAVGHAPSEMRSFGDEDGEEVIREGTPGYALDENGRPVDYHAADDSFEDEKHDLSYDGEDWVAQEQANLRSEKEDYDDDLEKSPAISFAGGFGAPPEVSHAYSDRDAALARTWARYEASAG